MVLRTSLPAAAGLLVAVSLLAACAKRNPVRPAPVSDVAVEVVPVEGWMAIATAADQRRLAGMDAAWASTLTSAKARAAGRVTSEGPLLDPQSALTRVAPPPGTYHCRVLILGNGGDRRKRPFEVFRPQTCFIVAEEKLLVLMKASGSNLFGGRLWDDGDKRMIFLGTNVDRPNAAAPPYGADARRDRAGVLERVGEFRWRLTTSLPTAGPMLEIVELVPKSPLQTPVAQSSPVKPVRRRAS